MAYWLETLQRHQVTAICLLFGLIQLPALFVSPAWFEYAIKVDIQTKTHQSYDYTKHSQHRVWGLEFMPAIYQAEQFAALIKNKQFAPNHNLLWAGLKERANRRDNITLSAELLKRADLNCLDVWPSYLPLLGIPRPIAWAIWALIFAIGARKWLVSYRYFAGCDD
jgi:hypothetical protein